MAGAPNGEVSAALHQVLHHAFVVHGLCKDHCSVAFRSDVSASGHQELHNPKVPPPCCPQEGGRGVRVRGAGQQQLHYWLLARPSGCRQQGFVNRNRRGVPHQGLHYRHVPRARREDKRIVQLQGGGAGQQLLHAGQVASLGSGRQGGGDLRRSAVYIKYVMHITTLKQESTASMQRLP